MRRGNLLRSFVAREVDGPTSQERYGLGGDIDLNVGTALTVTAHAEGPDRSTRLPRKGARVWVVANKALTCFVREVAHHTLLDLVAPRAKPSPLSHKRKRRLPLLGNRTMATLATCHPGRMDKLPFVLVGMAIQAGLALNLPRIHVGMFRRSLRRRFPVAEWAEKGAQDCCDFI